MNKRRSGTIASYAYTIVQMVVALVYVPLLIGGIGQAEFGLYQFVGSIMAYLTVLNATLSVGVSRFYCKYYAIGDEDGMANTLGIATKAVRWASLVSVAVGAVLAVVVRAVYAESFTAWELDESCLLLGVLVLNLMVSLSNTISVAVLTAHEEFVFYKMTCLVVLILQPIGVLVCMQWFPNALTVCVVQLVLNFALRMVQHSFAKRKLGMDTRLRYADAELQRSLLKFSGAIIMGVIADEIFWRTDQLILGYLYGTDAVAVYAVGSQICMTYMPLGTAFSAVFMPKISQIVNGGEADQAVGADATGEAGTAAEPAGIAEGGGGPRAVEGEAAGEPVRAAGGLAGRPDATGELSELFARCGRISLYPLLLVLSGFIVFGQDFIRLWAGPGFEQSYWVAVIIMVPFTVDIMQNIGIIILEVLDKYYFRARLYFVAALVNALLTCFLAWRYGYVGAAAATALTLVFTSGVAMNVYYGRTIGLDLGLFWRETLRYAAPVAVLGVAGWFAWSALSSAFEIGWLALVAGILAYTVVYGAVAWFVAGNDYERGLVRSMLGKLAHRGSGE